MIMPLVGLLLGLTVGWLLPVSMPLEYAKYMSVALMAGMDSVLGGVRSSFEDKYDNKIFITGFFSNTLLAVIITYIGERLFIDLYFVAILTFGIRMFRNIALIRRYILKKQ